MLLRRLVVLLAVLVVGAPAAPAIAAQPATSTLVAIRAAHHPTYDRVVFQFRGPVPRYTVGYQFPVRSDASGLPVTLLGRAGLRIAFTPATGHTESGRPTFAPAPPATGMPWVRQVAPAGDFEGVLSFGIGVVAQLPYRVMTLTTPSRVVVDVPRPVFATVRVVYLDAPRYATGAQPYLRAVPRTVTRPVYFRDVLAALYGGPTAAERARGLRFVASGTTGIGAVWLRGSVAHVRLAGPCASGGATLTVADLISATLRQLPVVKAVKIYDAAGTTERPLGTVDSIPTCLEP